MAETKNMEETKKKTATVYVKKSEYETGSGKRCEIVAVNGVRRSLLCDRNNTTTPAIAAEYKNRVALRTVALQHIAEAREKMKANEAKAGVQ